MASKLPEGVQGLKEAIQPEGTQGLREAIQPEGTQGLREAIQPEGDPTAILPEGAATPRAPRKKVRVLDETEQFLVLEARRYIPKVDPFPDNAPTIEKKTFPFCKKDVTQDGVRDNLKRISLYRSDLVGDKRREICRILPWTYQNSKQLLKLRNELNDLNFNLSYSLQKLKEVDPAEGEPPKHFKNFPVLKKH